MRASRVLLAVASLLVSGCNCVDPNAAIKCNSTADCMGDQVCGEGGVCAAPLTCPDTPCAATETCSNGRCLTPNCPGKTCGAGQACNNNRCTDIACLGKSCPGGVCLQGSCYQSQCANETCTSAEV